MSQLLSQIVNTNNVLLTGDQSIAGVKTFTSFPILPSSMPSSDYQSVNKAYVDNSAILSIVDGRLGLLSGYPAASGNQTAKTVLYYTPYNGNQIALYDGTNWKVHPFTELSLDIAGYTASRLYDIFVYNNSGTLTLDSAIWTNGTTRASALYVQDGVYVQTGATNKRYVGTIRITATAGQCEDSNLKRFVWNYYNQLVKLGLTYNTTASWSYTTGTWREYNNGTGQVRFEFIVGNYTGDIDFSISALVAGMSGGMYLGIGVDASGTQPICNYYDSGGIATTRDLPLGVATGYHFVTQYEYGVSGATIYGYSSVCAGSIKVRV